MSCFVCSDRIFKAVAKVCYYYGEVKIGAGYPITLDELNEFIKKVAELNCKNVSDRYNESVEVSVELLSDSDLPFDVITKQDITDCKCWDYQTCDYYSNDDLLKMVVEATEWAERVYNYTDADLDETIWG